LTDPDGAVTRVAPWSSWTREQVRAPGGEPALVTRLDQGQLWFAAGRRRSPWRHEVHVGPAVVSTPRGRFQAVAEPDGGATIACLAGRTRVVAGLREPVLLGPDQSAAVSSDGRTLVVMDRASGAEVTEPDVIDLTEAEAEADVETAAEADAGAGALARAYEEAEVAALAAVGAAEGGGGGGGHLGAMPGFEERPAEPEPAPEPLPYHEEVRPARLGWIPELVAVLAIVGLLVAGVWVLRSQGDGSTDVAAPPVTTLPISTTAPASTTASTATTATPTTTTAPTTTSAAPTTVTTRPPAATGATAIGELRACRRAEGSVIATVSVSHRSGPPSTFSVSATLVDPSGVEFARGTARSELIQPGGTGSVDVTIPTQGDVSGSCELLEVTSA
jgi:hypothetical protein